MFAAMDAVPRTVSMEDAVGAIADALGETGRVAGITGPAGAGKSTLAARLIDGAGGVVISTDEYLPDYERVPEAERDLPEHADLGLLAEHLGRLRAGEPAEIPVWSFHEHRRVDTRRVAPPRSGVIVVEGLFALHERLGGTIDLRVFVEAPRATRWARWEAIERRGERGMGVEAARAFFDGVADPTYARFAPGYRASADLIVANPGPAG
jgi:uridine kinase